MKKRKNIMGKKIMAIGLVSILATFFSPLCAKTIDVNSLNDYVLGSDAGSQAEANGKITLRHAMSLANPGDILAIRPVKNINTTNVKSMVITLVASIECAPGVTIDGDPDASGEKCIITAQSPFVDRYSLFTARDQDDKQTLTIQNFIVIPVTGGSGTVLFANRTGGNYVISNCIFRIMGSSPQFDSSAIYIYNARHALIDSNIFNFLYNMKVTSTNDIILTDNVQKLVVTNNLFEVNIHKPTAQCCIHVHAFNGNVTNIESNTFTGVVDYLYCGIKQDQPTFEIAHISGGRHTAGTDFVNNSLEGIYIESQRQESRMKCTSGIDIEQFAGERPVSITSTHYSKMHAKWFSRNGDYGFYID